MSHIEAGHLSYIRPDGRTLLDDVSFRLGNAAKAALVGPNGPGPVIAPPPGNAGRPGQRAAAAGRPRPGARMTMSSRWTTSRSYSWPRSRASHRVERPIRAGISLAS